jgi:hypothetical protein
MTMMMTMVTRRRRKRRRTMMMTRKIGQKSVLSCLSFPPLFVFTDF